VKLALDANLSPHLARAIHALLAPEPGEAVSIAERFGPGVTDQEWIGALHQEGGWAVLTADRRLRTRPHERHALEQSGLVVFILAPGWNQESYWSKAAGVVRWLPRILAAYQAAHPPALFLIPHRWTPAPLRLMKDE
jgi:PIN like domain